MQHIQVIYTQPKNKLFKPITPQVHLVKSCKVLAVTDEIGLVPAKEFFKDNMVIETQDFYVDYDVAVKIGQKCLYQATNKNETYKWVSVGAVFGKIFKRFNPLDHLGTSPCQAVYRSLVPALAEDQDYRHVKPLSTEEISNLTVNNLRDYLYKIIDRLSI